MEGKLQTSFIPKQPLVENKAKKVPMSANLFSVIGWIIFIIAVLASLGVFAYGQYLTSSIKTKNAQLTKRLNSFDATSVDHFVQLDARLQAANTILNNHMAVSTLFTLISDNTVQSIQFTEMKYTYDDSGKLILVLTGKAPDFASVALQSDRFSSQTYLRNQVFSNLGLDLDGGVLFKYTASVDPAALQYNNDNSASVN